MTALDIRALQSKRESILLKKGVRQSTNPKINKVIFRNRTDVSQNQPMNHFIKLLQDRQCRCR